MYLPIVVLYLLLPISSLPRSTSLTFSDLVIFLRVLYIFVCVSSSLTKEADEVLTKDSVNKLSRENQAGGGGMEKKEEF